MKKITIAYTDKGIETDVGNLESYEPLQKEFLKNIMRDFYGNVAALISKLPKEQGAKFRGKLEVMIEKI